MTRKTKLHTNRTYKSTVFIMLFEDKKNLLELYNAMTGKNYQDPEQLEINTLENAIYMHMKNDVSFEEERGSDPSRDSLLRTVE